MPSDIWIKQERLLPIGESQLTVTGLLRGGDPKEDERPPEELP